MTESNMTDTTMKDYTMMETKIPDYVMRYEAIRRMEALELDPKLIARYDKYGLVPFYVTGISGTELSVDPQLHFATANFEKQHHARVYCIIITAKGNSINETLLYVSQDIDNWENEENDIEDCFAEAWIENITEPENSGFGIVDFYVDHFKSVHRI